MDPDREIIFETEVTNDTKYLEFNGPFKEGQYKAVFSSKKAENIKVELKFD